jgi:HEAT repeat protein
MMSMPSDSPSTRPETGSKELPPVQAPSGRFIIQLFLVPGLVVTVAVLILLGFSWLVGGESAPDKLLDRLESPNAEVRWRAASEMAQRLKRDEALAANPKVALRLTALLHKAADELERIPKGTTDAERADEKKMILEKRRDVEFMAPCVGHMIVPAGAEVLSDLSRTGRGHDPKSKALLRRQAVWSLAHLGENVRRFSNLPAEKRDEVLAQLHAASMGSGEPAKWARHAYGYLNGTTPGLGVIPALVESASADDPFLRTAVAFALTFWEGTGEEKALAEKTLKVLSYDDGRGTRIEIGDGD